ncbi:flavin-containing monooxygenase [Mycobacterium paragordonae]|uniref:NAD(P)/FAD-dependent oxidoreductase n=1 Tax=Mycobacterium paragordonae TaxID=1389713 RepID=A0A4R5WZ62_9MYCO|nr:NAD(P)/FAD-dependent oxidoreductase [Mycobacterium paragordonae]MDP7737719.1 NAD(P)/FAD-dependent oxidoreductase [Mycobacterium paragordonae]TDK98399.1 NAD(P)/FAD-dependent oxidoreductase [Mycobacterium paragordonae]TDL02346.1 NAD(P)/FAD-dependent oxidoreductase [Mycobacterium paragordonae]TDL12860.1 NAD(P)/FAD-dependent oxidoreductase [Mycobacterium paragordonae]
MTGTVGRTFDVEALRQKYAQERSRRLRPDGIAQYVEIAGEFARFAADPWAEGNFTREPVTDEVDVAIVGAGFGGLLTGVRLRQLGVESIRLIDRAADVGGTWYWNRYPGIACDVESYVYIPLLEELGYIPQQKYARGAEIFEHCRRIAEHYDLYRDACLQTDVHEIRWDEATSRWIIKTNHGDEMRAKFVSMANGYQAKPKLPGIAGINDFRGNMFHTSRWDYAYTGAQLENLSDKRVGIIGTGATAVQCVPHLGAAAQRLYVFQRTPSSVDVRANGPTDPLWANTLQPGWQRERIENFQILTSGGQADKDLVADAWTSITRKLPVMRHDTDATVSPEQRGRDIEVADFAKMEEIRARVDEIVVDPATAQALKPWYGYFCKRPCFHDDYLQTFNRENVTLVDTRGRGVEQITEAGVVVDGVTYELDCLIFATGFEVGTDYCRRTGFELIGRDGVTLTERWNDGVRTFQGLCANGFPNCFIESIAQAGLTVNFPYLLDVQATHAAWIIAWALEHGVREVEASAAAEAAWVETVVQRSAATAERAKTCTPGYYNREGKADAKTRQGSFFFGGPTEYADLLAAWRAGGDLAGFDIRPSRDLP